MPQRVRTRSVRSPPTIPTTPLVRLEAVVERVFLRCLEDGQHEHAIGLALESRRLDRLSAAVDALGAPGEPDRAAALEYAMTVARATLSARDFRAKVLRLLVTALEREPKPDHSAVCLGLMALDDAPAVARVLHRLLSGSEDDALTALQMGFDLVDNEIQLFLRQVREELSRLAPPAPEATEPATAPAALYHARSAKLATVLSGDASVAAHFEFLRARNKTDIALLKNTKQAFEARNSVLHSATVLANAYMQCGTTADVFLRENLDWVSRATNWAKFSAAASLGCIHRGNLSQSRDVVAPYLNARNNTPPSPYAEGGALYALGLIHANHGDDITAFLLERLRGTTNEVVQHGACLGLGLAGLSTMKEDIFEDVKAVLYTDSAVAGEAAGIALGLVEVGSGSEKVTEMLAYARDTQHEKIVRGLGLGIALMNYAREGAADTLIEQLLREQDPILRYGGMYTIGLAYCGTASNPAIQRLLKIAVSDVSDDVRRAAVLNLGFVLCGQPEQCPKIVALLAESYNPHTRYGAAMAVGIACAGSGSRAALQLLEPLQTDAVDYVRQGALIATALVLVAQPESSCKDFRAKLEKVIGEKHEATMCKMGAIMASGIVNAGGRNCTVQLKPAGSAFLRMTSVVGMAVFTQYWYWYPLSHFLSIAFQPSALIGVNADLLMPKFAVDCRCRPSLFAYPPPVQERAKAEVGKTEKAVLSTTARAKERQKRKDADKKKKDGDSMDVDEPSTAPKAASTAEGAASTADGAAATSTAPAGPEPTTHSLENPARVVPDQERFLRLPEGSRWVPVRPRGRLAIGVTVLRDLRPEEPVELVREAAAPAPAAAPAAPAPAAPAAPVPVPAAAPAAEGGAGDGSSPMDEGDEPPPPAPFTYTPH